MYRESLPTGSLVVRLNVAREPHYEAKWRDSKHRQRKRRPGAAWLEADGSGG